MILRIHVVSACLQDVRRLRDILALHADEVFSLENRKFQLKMSAQERTHEVSTWLLFCCCTRGLTLCIQRRCGRDVFAWQKSAAKKGVRRELGSC